MRINRGINIYHMGKLERRDMNEEVITSDGINGFITLTVKDFCGLIKIRDPGFVNDNIINAFLQTLDTFSRHYSRGVNGSARIPPHSVFLSTQTLETLEKAATLAEKDAARHKKVLQRVFGKHGVTSANLPGVENVFLPIHLRATDSENQHWVLAIWHPRQCCMTWWDSAVPEQRRPRGRFAEVGRYIKHFWADFCRSEVPQPNGPPKVVEIDQSTWNARDIKCPQQKNASDCGVFVMAACLCRVLNFNAFITGEGRGNLMRNYLAAVLLQHGWGGELPWGMPSPTIMPPRHYEEEISSSDPTYMRI
jgi:hypothetical protein